MNCFIGAVWVRARLGGRLRFRPPRSGNPWGHWFVEIGNTRISYSPDNKDLAWWRQVWFSGHFKRKST